MKHKAITVIVAVFLTASAFAQSEPQVQQRDARQQNNSQQNQALQNQAPQNRARLNQAPQNQLQQIQQSLADLYLSDFRSQIELNEDQFLSVAPIIRQFMQMRFRAANRRENLNQRLNRLLSQSNPSETQVQQLIDEKAQLESQSAGMEVWFVNTIRPYLTTRQVPRVLDFNRTFFNERLPDLIGRAREMAASRGQRQQQRQQQRPAEAARPNTRQNSNRPANQSQQGDAFNGK
jgi:hypothetical protein